MTRSTKHTLKFTTKAKREQINNLFLIYSFNILHRGAYSPSIQREVN